MSRFRVVITDHVFQDFDQERAILGAVDAALEVCQCRTVADLLDRVADADGLLNTYLAGIDARVFDAAPVLKAVVRYGIGVDTIDIAEAGRRGIAVANVPDYCIDEVADHALAHFLCLARKIALADRRVKGGEWSLAAIKPLPAIRTMRAGIIGFGRIGRAIAARLKPLGCDIVFTDPCIDAVTDDCEPVSLDALFATCHAIFVQCPSTPETHHLIDAEACAAMANAPLIINCARGDIVDTEALVQALRSGRVSGAGLDLLEDHEDVVESDHPLKTMDNVILTPHSAWFSDTAIPMLQRRAAETMAQVLAGERPASLLNPEVLA